jgi:hypothetical protein
LDNFTNEAFELDLSTPKIYIGFHKPLKNIYIELDSRIADDETVVEYWNGTTWVELSIDDFTNGLTVSGLISWPEIAQVKTTHLTYGEMYWIRLSTTETPASVFINGINLVLSNDKDLSFIPNLTQYLPNGTTSFIGFHQEARDLIVQTIRNSGKKILRFEPSETLNSVSSRQVDQFDLLEIEEFRNASKYMALHLIFDYLSKSDDDGYRLKADRYYTKYTETLNTNLISVDQNDNGETDEAENQTVQFIRIRRE